MKIVVTFKSSHCRYFKNCIGRKCESSSIPTSSKLRWGVEIRPTRGRILTRGRGVGKVRFNPPAIRTLLFPLVITRRPGLRRCRHEFTLPEKDDHNFIFYIVL